MYAILKIKTHRKLPMTQRQRTLIYGLLGLQVGNLTLTDTRLTRWGNEVTLSFIYRYPPEEKTFRLIFKRCRGIEWHVVKEGIAEGEQAQLMTHDLGEQNYQRTARIATVLVEIIISYGELAVEKDW
jgi:hypothetical protein